VNRIRKHFPRLVANEPWLKGKHRCLKAPSTKHPQPEGFHCYEWNTIFIESDFSPGNMCVLLTVGLSTELNY
jgi:hypothetical protein